MNKFGRGDIVTSQRLVGVWEVGKQGTGVSKNFVWVTPRGPSLLIHEDQLWAYHGNDDE